MSIHALHDKLAAHPERMMRFLSLDGTLVTKSFADVHDDVDRLVAQLTAAGIGAEDTVGILGPNSYEWVIADLALLSLKSVSVALPAEQNAPVDPEQLCTRYDLSALLLTKALPGGAALPPAVALLGDGPVALTKRRRSRDKHPPLPDDVFTIAFSSGTSGTKKGLMLTTEGVENTILTSIRSWEVRQDDNILIVMPFSNFQQRYLMYTAIWAGCDATVVAPERMFQRLGTFQPTIILGPPSFFEIMYNRVQAASRREKLPYYCAALLHAVAPARLTRGVRARLGRKWTRMYGPRTRLMFTGSAPVPSRTVELFQRLAAPLFEVYGSTEVGWIAFNLPGAHRTGRAGRPVDGVDVTIAPDGEVIVRTATPQAAGYVFAGMETERSVFLGDHRLATGDLGRLDPAGFLQLRGRKKNVIITRSGVKINPEEMEEDVEQNCRVRKAVVVSPGQDGLLTCIVWVDDEEDAAVAAEIEAYVESANQKRAASHRISRLLVRPAPELTVDTGLLTRNLKVDREAVIRRVFADSNRVG